MKITIISVGKKISGPEAELISEYTRRLDNTLSLDWKFIPHGQGEPEIAKKNESAKVLEYLQSQAGSFAILLDERGKSLDNSTLAEIVKSPDYSQIIFVIGGAYGVALEVQNACQKVYKISDLILPHRLVRIVLSEQIYRSQAINKNHPYHHS